MAHNERLCVMEVLGFVVGGTDSNIQVWFGRSPLGFALTAGGTRYGATRTLFGIGGLGGVVAPPLDQPF